MATSLPNKGSGFAFRFDRREFAGSLGDLGTLLPIAIGLILINGMDGAAVITVVGAYYILSGLYFRVTVPVQPMKVIGAYAIARSLSPLQISISGLWIGLFLLLLAVTNAITVIGRYVPRSTIRGVQLTTGILLLVQGLKFMLGQTALQLAHGATEPFLFVSTVGPVPIGLIIGPATTVLILLLLENRTTPAALAAVGAGAVVGLALGAYRELAGLHLAVHLPTLFPYGVPGWSEAALALVVLALPQAPMTLGNAVIAQADLTREYFGEQAARRSSLKGLSVSMGLANVCSSLVGGMPICHGAGGLAAHHRFGARTAGSNLMIGAIFLAAGILVGDQAAALFSAIPLSALGALLVFAGAQLALMVLDVTERRDMFVTLSVLGVALATNLAVGFAVGIALAYALRIPHLKV